MQTSHKLLITIGGLLVGLLIIGLMLVRADFQVLLAKESRQNYYTLDVGSFDQLEFSRNWEVSIYQNRLHKVELVGQGANEKIDIYNDKGTVHFGESLSDSTKLKWVRIGTPSLRHIIAESGTRIELVNFKMDTLQVMLEGNASFHGDETTIEYLLLKSDGQAQFELSKDLSM